MDYIIPNTPPETVLSRIAGEALGLLALGGERALPDIVPLETALPLTAKAWELPESLLKEKTDLLARGKAQAAAGEAVLPGVQLLESYDGWEITGLLWGLLRTAAQLEEREERQALYDAAQLLLEALDYHSFLCRAGKNYLKAFWGTFRNMVRKADPAKRGVICEKANALADRLYCKGVARGA